MTTTSRRLSQRLKHSRASSTPGKTKGANCVRPKDWGIACNSNPYKGKGLGGNEKGSYDRLWNYYKNSKGNK